jgi:hypothetical protein
MTEFEAFCEACQMKVSDIRTVGARDLMMKTGHNTELQDGKWSLVCSAERRRRRSLLRQA